MKSYFGPVTVFRKSWHLWDNVQKYCTAGQTTDDSIIWSMWIVWWIPRAKNQRSEYVIHSAFSLEHWLHESDSMSRKSNWTSLGRMADIREVRVQVPAVRPNILSHISDRHYKYSSNKPNSSEPQMRLSTTFDSLTLTYPRTIRHKHNSPYQLLFCQQCDGKFQPARLVRNGLMCLRTRTDRFGRN